VNALIFNALFSSWFYLTIENWRTSSIGECCVTCTSYSMTPMWLLIFKSRRIISRFGNLDVCVVTYKHRHLQFTTNNIAPSADHWHHWEPLPWLTIDAKFETRIAEHHSKAKVLETVFHLERG